MTTSTRIILFLTAVLLLAGTGAAHEVYVLPADQINQSMMTDSPNPLTAAQAHRGFVAVFILGVLAAIGVVLFLPHTERFNRYTPVLEQLTGVAPYLAQATLGLGLIAAATTQSLFGPEIPLHTVSDNVQVLSLLLYLAGLVLIFNIETRIAGLFALLTYLVTYHQYGGYALHYLAYMGLALFVVLRNDHPFIDEFITGLFPTNLLPSRIIDRPGRTYLLLRICYGAAIVYAALYAKYLYSNLALATIEHHMLTQYVPLNPLLIVLFALLTELLIGAAIIAGIAVRPAAALILFMNGLSFLVLQEPLWPHIWMIGGALAVFAHGYDAYTIQPAMQERLQTAVRYIR